MSQNNELSVYPEDDVSSRLLQYQQENSLSKSKAAEDLIKRGLDAHETGLIDEIYVELAKICGIVGLLLLMIVAVSDGGALPFNPVYVSFVFIAASFVFILAERYGPNVRSLFSARQGTDEDAARG